MFRRRLTAVAVALGLAVLGSGSAKAGLLPVAVSVTPEAGNYRWTYAIVLPTDSQLQSGNYFTIYDFRGLIPNSEFAPEGWEFTTTKLGPTPALLLPDDNPDLPNLSFRYTGPTIDAGQTGLGNFWAVSEFGERTDSFFTARTNRTSDGRFDENITETVVPVPADTPPPPPVPEPTTLALAGLGLPLVALARRFRKS
jgi:PEP-CTERM motif